MKTGQRKVRKAIGWAATIALIILWAIPGAYVLHASQLTSSSRLRRSRLQRQLPLRPGALPRLALQAPHARQRHHPGALLDPRIDLIAQGALPPIALAVLFMLLPVVLRLFAKLGGVPLYSLIEIELVRPPLAAAVLIRRCAATSCSWSSTVRYCRIRSADAPGFLIVTIASSLVAAIPQIVSNPASAVTLLATYLPQAATFFLTYFVTVGLGGALATLFRLVPLILGVLLPKILGSTPRKVYNLDYKMADIKLGAVWPAISLLCVRRPDSELSRQHRHRPRLLVHRAARRRLCDAGVRAHGPGLQVSLPLCVIAR